MVCELGMHEQCIATYTNPAMHVPATQISTSVHAHFQAASLWLELHYQTVLTA